MSEIEEVIPEWAHADCFTRGCQHLQQRGKPCGQHCNYHSETDAQRERTPTTEKAKP